MATLAEKKPAEKKPAEKKPAEKKPADAKKDNFQNIRFVKADFFTPLIFLVMFVIFIYGALLVGLLGVSDWIIHAWQLTFLLNLGGFGIVLLALALPLTWGLIAILLATLGYKTASYQGHFILAEKVATVIIFAMFHIFTLPFILWPMIRRASPSLRKKHYQKLRKMVKAGKANYRLEERKQKLLKKGYSF